jgi:hypothetical protein
MKKRNLEWYEMLNWNEMEETWKMLSEEIKDKIRESGKAPVFDKKKE